MANAYVDLGTWWCVTPYVGAGIGMANIKISGFRDDGFNYTPRRAEQFDRPTPRTPRSGISPGRCTPASPTR